MTVDIATLGIKIDSTDARTATQDLNAFRDAGTRAEQSTASLEAMTRKLQGALQFLGIGAGVGAIIRMSDDYAKLTAQLRLATESQQAYVQAYGDVKRIATSAQQDLSATGMLYARVAKATSELGVSQKAVADITETVSLAMKVSGASANESAQAQLQLSQAFASGTLRGDEFNAVNEAAPRLMKALADGMGRPIGELRNMAAEGQITSKVMADVLPKALQQLQEEAKQVQTIAGAFTVLKNNVMEFVGIQAQANGVVSALTGGIDLLAKNLTVLAGVVLTLSAAKFATYLTTWIESANGAMVASRALAVAKIAEAEAAATATASASLLTAARVAELRATAAATGGEVALGLALTGIIPAQARAAAAATAHELAMERLALAQASAAATTTVLGRAMTLLAANPIGAIITVLGIAATAWSWYGSKADEANKKAEGSTEQSTYEIIANIEKQNAKLRERLALAKQAGLADAAKGGGPEVERMASLLKDINDLKARGNALTSVDQVQLVNLQGLYDGLARGVAERSGLKSEIDASGKAATDLIEVRERLAGVNKQYMDDLTKLQAARAAGAVGETEYIRLVSELAMQTYAKSQAGKDANATTDKEAEAYRNLIDPLREKSAANEHEIETGNALTESQKAIIKLNEDQLNATVKLTPKHRDEVRAIIEKTGAQDKWLLAAKNTKAAVQALDDEYASAYAAAVAEAQANEELVKAFGKTKAQVEELTLARLEDRLAQRGTLELDAKEVAQLERMIEAKRRNAAALKQLDVLDTGSAVTKAKELLEILTAVDAATRQAAQGMEASFGRVGSAIGGLTTALSGYAVQQQAIAAQLAAAKSDPKNSAQKIAQAEIAASKASAQAQIKSYGDMAGAAKGFFKEHTAGYKVMEGAEKAFRAYEMALAIEAMVKKIFFKEAEVAANVTGNATKLTSEATTTAASTTLAGTEASAWGVTAVVKALASLPFPLNLAAGAATLAAVIAIGGKVMGSLGGGGGNTTAQDRQKQAGTGSVFGDTKAKSDSIAKSMELVAANSDIELSYTRGMLTSLRNIENSIGGLANLLIRTTDLSGKVAGDTKSFDSKLVSGVGAAAGGLGGAALGTYLGMGMAAIGGPLGLAIGAVVGTLLGKTFVGKALSSVFGGSKSVTDTGLVVAPTNVGSIKTGGVNSSQYTDVKTDGGWFRSDKTSTTLSGLGAEANDQFTKVIVGLASTITEAGKLLGLGGDEFTARLNSFVVDIGKISLKGLTGEEIQKQLETVFSKLGDDMAKFAVDGLASFQKVGEGYFETLTRVASNYANLDSILMSIGTTFGATGVASISARERLIDLAGGIDKLAEQAAGFAENFLSEAERLAPIKKYVTDQLAALGYAAIDTRDKFKDLVLSLINSGAAATEEGAKRVTALLDLQELVNKIYPAIAGATKSTADLQQQLQDAYDAESEAINATIDRHMAYAASLRRFQDSLLLGDLSPLTPEQRYQEAKAQYGRTLALAQGGDENAQANLEASATAFLNASKLVNASGVRYQEDFAQVRDATANAVIWAEKQVDIGRATLSALDKSVDGILAVKTEVVSVAEAIRQLSGTLTAAQQATLASNNTAAIESLYQQLLGRHSDAEGLEFWKKVLAGGTSISEIVKLIVGSPEYQSKLTGTPQSPLQPVIQGAVAQPMVLNLRDYGTQNTEALVSAIRDLRDENAALASEIKQLRTDQKQQTGDEIEANYDATSRAAGVIADATVAAIRAVSEKRVDPT